MPRSPNALPTGVSFKRIVNDLLGAGWTQKALAERCFVSQAYISKLKTGERDAPAYELGAALINLYRTDCFRTVPTL